MSGDKTTTCPQCGTTFQVASSQLQQAGGRVRCGNCLQVFDGVSGEAEFIVPRVSDEGGEAVFADLRVRPMARADLPSPPPRASRVAFATLILLTLLLGAQFIYWQQQGARARALEIGQLAVRPHPAAENALRLDAVVKNNAAENQPYPILLLSFTNVHGERRAQRAFLPGEYLHGDYPPELPPGSEVQISLSIKDPGREAVNYLLQLHSVTPAPN